MAAGDSAAAWPMMASHDVRVTIPSDMRASLESWYVETGPTRWCPPPPQPQIKMVAVWLVFLLSGLVALIYMSLGTG